MKKRRWIKRAGSTHVTFWTPILAKKPGFIECDVEGNALGGLEGSIADANPEIASPPISKMTRLAIMNELDERGVEYGSKEHRARLLKLLSEVRAAEEDDEDPEIDEGETETDTVPDFEYEEEEDE